MSGIQRVLRAGVPDQSHAGTWRIYAKPWGKSPQDVTVVRGMPTVIGDFGFGDPFGPTDLSMTFPQVSVFDRIGSGDLYWLKKHVDVDVVWDGPLPEGFAVVPVPPTWQYGKDMHGVRRAGWRWEGYMASFARTNDGITVQCKGALMQMDNWLAKPEYPTRPLPYEWAMARQFLNKPGLRVMPLRVAWPSWWQTRYMGGKGPSYLVPAGVTRGDYWTGLLTRSTGSWDPVLTSYIQGLLAAMYDERGRWTIDLDQHRQPVLFHRDIISVPNESTIVIDLTTPGVKASFNEDWEQSMTTVYGQGTSLAGVAFSGMQVSGDGSQTTYAPLAYIRQAYPALTPNEWWDPSVMTKEVYLQMQSGLSQDDAALVARAHLSRFTEPGQTGTCDLGSDPMVGGEPIPRHLVRAGMTVHFPKALGLPGGVIGHVTASRHNVATGSVNLTFDTKFRDQLTVEEVRLRGRDALSVSRMLVAGAYKPPVDDQMLPWSYAEGSGVIPSNATYNATRLFSDMPSSIPFPWSEWTTARPPRNPAWKSCYLHIGPAQSNADANWMVQQTESGTGLGVPIKMAQAGNIRLLQVAAYDAFGNVMKVPFHIGFYYVGGVNVMSMPRIPAEQETLFPPYRAGQHYPFVRDGFETYKISGELNDPNTPQPTQSVALLRAYGTFYEKAGYWPGSYAEGDVPTGLLVDESQWGFDTTKTADAYFDPYRAERNLTNPKAGRLYAMIYCDGQLSSDVYFLGRMFRVEPGTEGSTGQ